MYFVLGEEIESSLLLIIFDTHPNQRLYREQQHVLTQTLDSVIAFSNSHLMLGSKNKLAVLTCHAKTTEFLYPSRGESSQVVRQQDGQYELFTQVEKSIKINLQKLLKKEASCDKDLVTSDSLIAGAIAMALCYINRQVFFYFY